MDKLLPCPFCGGEAIKSAFSWGGITDEYTIECTICGTRTKVLKSEEAIKKWNTRKPMERIIEELEEELELAEKEEKRCLMEHSQRYERAEQYALGISNALDIVRNGGKE